MAESCTLKKTIQRSLRGSSVLAPTALGANMSQETDDMHDDLFKKYGKVVYKSSDKKSPISEVDAECLAFAVALAKIASDVKAADIKLLFVKPLVCWARFFLISTAFSRPQIDAIREPLTSATVHILYLAFRRLGHLEARRKVFMRNFEGIQDPLFHLSLSGRRPLNLLRLYQSRSWWDGVHMRQTMPCQVHARVPAALSTGAPPPSVFLSLTFLYLQLI